MFPFPSVRQNMHLPFSVHCPQRQVCACLFFSTACLFLLPATGCNWIIVCGRRFQSGRERKKREGEVKVGASRSVQRQHATCKVTFQTKSNKCFIDGEKTHTASKQMCNGLINNTTDLSESMCVLVCMPSAFIFCFFKKKTLKSGRKKRKTHEHNCFVRMCISH